MELKQIQCFLMVAKYLSFSAAAEKMFLSQPSLSRHIANLEQELGIQLFERDKQSVTLTAAGNQCLNAARNMISAKQEISNIAKDLQEGRLGSLRIRPPPASCCLASLRSSAQSTQTSTSPSRRSPQST